MHLTSIPTCMNLLIWFYLIQFFHYHELYHGPKGKFSQVWKVVISPKLKRLCSPKLVCMHLTQSLLAWIFWADSIRFNFFVTMDKSMVWKKIWPLLKVAISLKLKRSRPQKLVYVHLTSIPTCIDFLSRFYSIQFFVTMGLSSWNGTSFMLLHSFWIFMTHTHTCTFLHLHL